MESYAPTSAETFQSRVGHQVSLPATTSCPVCEPDLLSTLRFVLLHLDTPLQVTCSPAVTQVLTEPNTSADQASLVARLLLTPSSGEHCVIHSVREVQLPTLLPYRANAAAAAQSSIALHCDAYCEA